MDGKTEALLDTCVLINFAAIGRLDLLASHPLYTFVITDHVREEIKEHYSEQFDAVNAAIGDGMLTEIAADQPGELTDFAALVARKNLGNGECSAIAVARNRSIPLAIDDRRARNRATQFESSIVLLSTESLMVDLIQDDILTVADADAIKLDWETNHSFTLKFASFAEKI
jgi:predicted nucleic acid-binding protein